MTSTRYEDVCPRDNGAGVFNDYKVQLYCDGDDITVWRNKRSQFRSKHYQAKECALRRIERMKSYAATTPQEISERRSHVFPIQTAYTFAKDCLRKTADNPDEINNFTKEINNEISQVAAQRPNIISPQVFGNKGIEQSIKHPDLHQILNKTYYTPDAWNVIFKGRNALSTYGRNLSKIPNNMPNNDYNRVMNNYNKYEKLRTTHWGKTRKQRKLKSRRKSRRNAIL